MLIKVGTQGLLIITVVIEHEHDIVLREWEIAVVRIFELKKKSERINPKANKNKRSTNGEKEIYEILWSKMKRRDCMNVFEKTKDKATQFRGVNSYKAGYTTIQSRTVGQGR